MLETGTNQASFHNLPDDALNVIGTHLMTHASLTCSVHHQVPDGRIRAYCRVIPAWDAKMLLMPSPLVMETGIFYNAKPKDLGLHACRRLCNHWDGAEMVVNSRGEQLRVYHWDSGACAYAHAYDIVENSMKRTNYIFYDAVVEDRLDDLPAGCVVQVHKGHNGMQIRVENGSRIRLKKFVVIVKENQPPWTLLGEPSLVLSRTTLLEAIPTTGSGSFILTRAESSDGLLGSSFSYDMMPYDESIEALQAAHFTSRRDNQQTVVLIRRIRLSKRVVLETKVEVADLVVLRTINS